jgi:hypothetical protein
LIAMDRDRAEMQPLQPKPPRRPTSTSRGTCCGERCLPCEFRILAASDDVQVDFVESWRRHASSSGPSRRSEWTNEIVRPGGVIAQHDPAGVYRASATMRDEYFRGLRVAQLQEEEAVRLAKALRRRQVTREKLAAATARRESLQRQCGVVKAQPPVGVLTSPRAVGRPAATAVPPPPVRWAAELEGAAAGDAAPVPTVFRARAPMDDVVLGVSPRPASILGHMRLFRSSSQRADVCGAAVLTPRCVATPLVASDSSRPASARPARSSCSSK